MMRRQRSVFTLASQDYSSFPQDDSSLPVDSESTSVSSSYFYPESACSQVISPETQTLIPYYIYPYPFIGVPGEQVVPSVPDFFKPPSTASDFNHFDALIHNDDCNTTYGDEFIFEDYSAYGDSVTAASNYNDDYSCISNQNFNTPYVGESNEYDIHNVPYVDAFVPEDCSPFTAQLNNDLPQDMPSTGPIVTDYGTVTILLRHLVRVDITPAKAVYVSNPPAACVAAINGRGDRSCIIHPNGRVLNHGYDIHMETLNRKAKICKRGIVFTSEDHCLSYVVDAAGTKTTTERFRKLDRDFSLEVFYSDVMAEDNAKECYRMVDESFYKSYSNGDEVWFFGGIRIKQDERGDVKVTRNGGRFIVRTSPTTGQVFVKTHLADMNIGRYHHKYFAVRYGEKRVTASFKGFNVQNKTQKAGFNNSGRLVLF